jgi:hypothetical protein
MTKMYRNWGGGMHWYIEYVPRFGEGRRCGKSKNYFGPYIRILVK